jgi:hypothetical protein
MEFIAVNFRTLQDGTEVEVFEEPITLVVHTKCPPKWKLVDMETGIEYTGQVPDENGEYHWKRTDA